jgi:hypothetical protein
MSRFYIFGFMAFVLLVMCFAGWKVLHLPAAAPANEVPALAQAALAHPVDMTIASIRKGGTGQAQMGGYGVVQAAAVPTQSLRDQCALTLLACVSDVGKSPECFEPSMAIKISTASGEFLFMPCFKCGHMKVIQHLAGQTEEWSWVEIRATGAEFAPIFQAAHLPLPPAT